MDRLLWWGPVFLAARSVASGVRINGQQLPAVVIHAAVFGASASCCRVDGVNLFSLEEHVTSPEKFHDVEHAAGLGGRFASRAGAQFQIHSRVCKSVRYK